MCHVVNMCLFFSHDFRLILRDVRSRNNNKLSGLSLDAIVQQMKDLIEARQSSGMEKPSVAAAATPTNMPSAIPAPLTMPSGLPSIPHHLGSGLPNNTGLSSGFPNTSGGLTHVSSGSNLPGFPHVSNGNSLSGLPHVSNGSNLHGLPHASSAGNLSSAIGLPLGGGGIPHMARAGSMPGAPLGSAPLGSGLTARGLSDSGMGRSVGMGMPPAYMSSATLPGGVAQNMPPSAGVGAPQYFSQAGFPSVSNSLAFHFSISHIQAVRLFNFRSPEYISDEYDSPTEHFNPF